MWSAADFINTDLLANKIFRLSDIGIRSYHDLDAAVMKLIDNYSVYSLFH